MRRSTNHLFFHGEYEYFQAGTDVYRVRIDAAFDALNNIRTGARWQCTMAALPSLKKVLDIKEEE